MPGSTMQSLGPKHIIEPLKQFVPVKVGPLSFAAFPRDVAVYFSPSKTRDELVARRLVIEQPQYGKGMYVLTEAGEKIVNLRFLGRRS